MDFYKYPPHEVRNFLDNLAGSDCLVGNCVWLGTALFQKMMQVYGCYSQSHYNPSLLDLSRHDLIRVDYFNTGRLKIICSLDLKPDNMFAAIVEDSGKYSGYFNAPIEKGKTLEYVFLKHHEQECEKEHETHRNLIIKHQMDKVRIEELRQKHKALLSEADDIFDEIERLEVEIQKDEFIISTTPVPPQY